MAQSVRPDAGIDIASLLLDDIQYQRSKYYYFLGGIESWGAAGTAGGSADIPPVGGAVNDPLRATEEGNRALRSEIAFVKRIAPNEVSLTTRRINWTSGTVYDFWDHTQIMANTDFYVLTDDFNVYKCLDNNTHAPSTVKPTGTDIYPTRTADGYLWKYMYNVPPFKRLRFSSATTMPIQRALTDSFYNNGAIDGAVVVSEGSGYTESPSTLITVPDLIPGVTTGSGAIIETIELDNGSIGVGAITDITVALAGTGSGYTRGARVVINGNGKGVGASAHAVFGTGANTGKIMSIVIDNPGYGYDPSLVDVTIEVGGAEVLAVVSAATGSIIKALIVDPGTGYVDDSDLTLTITGTGGTGKYGNPTAILSAVTYNGSIQHVNTIDPGLNYPFLLSTFIVAQGDGVNASFIPVIYNGGLIDVVVDNPGSGYTTIDLTVYSGSGVGAVVRGIIAQSDYTSDQMIVEQTAVDGAIHHIHIVGGGSNYTINDPSPSIPPRTIVEVQGNGEGCVARAVVGQNGVIERINIISPGSGYSYATVVITDLDRPGGLIPPGDRAEVYAILPPVGGHGHDATQELDGSTLAISTSLRNEMEIESIVQDFRTYGIIRNPRNLLTGRRYQAASSLIAFKLNFLSSTGLNKDDIMTLGTNRYRVLTIDGTLVSLLALDDLTPTAPIGELTQVTTGIKYQSVTTVQSIDFDKYSGALLYASTEDPFSFTADQSLIIKTYVKF